MKTKIMVLPQIDAASTRITLEIFDEELADIPFSYGTPICVYTDNAHYEVQSELSRLLLRVVMAHEEAIRRNLR